MNTITTYTSIDRTAYHEVIENGDETANNFHLIIQILREDIPYPPKWKPYQEI